MNNKKSDDRNRLPLKSVAARLFYLFLVSASLCLPTSGQMKDNKKLSHLSLPGHLRAQLIERFNLFVDYERQQCYEKQFDVLAKPHLANLLHMDVTKESYIKFKQETEIAVGKLIELRVKDIERTSDSYESLSFSVRAKLQKGKSTYFDEPIFVAYLLNGDWYFSLLYVN